MKYTSLILALFFLTYQQVTAEIQYVGDEDLKEIDKALSGTVVSLVIDQIAALKVLEDNRTTECKNKQAAIYSDCTACREACQVTITPEVKQMEQQGAQDAQDISNLANVVGSAALEAILRSASKDIDRFGRKNKKFLKKLFKILKTLQNQKNKPIKILKDFSIKTLSGIKNTVKQLAKVGKHLLKGSLNWLKKANEKVGKVINGLGDGLRNVGRKIKDFTSKLFTGEFRQPRFRLPAIGRVRVIRYDRNGFPGIILPSIRTPRSGLLRFSKPRLGFPGIGFPRFGSPRILLPDIRTPRYSMPSIRLPRYSIPISSPRVSVFRYSGPRVSLFRYSSPRVSVNRYSISSSSGSRYSASRYGGSRSGGGGGSRSRNGKKRDSSCGCRMCDILEKSGKEIVTTACGENFFQEQNATINEISSLTSLYNFLSNTQLLIKISMDVSSLLLTDDGYYIKNSNMTIQYPEGVEIDMKMIEGMPYSDDLNTTRIASVEGPAVYSKLIKV